MRVGRAVVGTAVDVRRGVLRTSDVALNSSSNPGIRTMEGPS
jgi:hypothetical protein